jgi:hypothetical protein
VRDGPGFTISDVRSPTNGGSGKKFYHRISAPPAFVAIWQGIQPAVRIRSRVARSPIVPESASRPPSASTPPKSHTNERPNPTPLRRQGIIVSDGKSRCAFPSCRNRGRPFEPAGKYDARTVTLRPRSFIILALPCQSRVCRPIILIIFDPVAQDQNWLLKDVKLGNVGAMGSDVVWRLSTFAVSRRSPCVLSTSIPAGFVPAHGMARVRVGVTSAASGPTPKLPGNVGRISQSVPCSGRIRKSVLRDKLSVSEHDVAASEIRLQRPMGRAIRRRPSNTLNCKEKTGASWVFAGYALA